jgi:hypothetical protein
MSIVLTLFSESPAAAAYRRVLRPAADYLYPSLMQVFPHVDRDSGLIATTTPNITPFRFSKVEPYLANKGKFRAWSDLASQVHNAYGVSETEEDEGEAVESENAGETMDVEMEIV